MDFNEEKQMKVLKKAYDSLTENGMLCAIQPCIEKDRKTFSIGLDISLAMTAYY